MTSPAFPTTERFAIVSARPRGSLDFGISGTGNMIRLAICGVDEATRREIGRRLRAASVVAGVEPFCRQTIPSNCDAVAFLGSTPLVASDIEQIIGAGIQMLLATESIFSLGSVGDLVERGRQTGLQIAVRNPDEALPSRQLVRQQLDSTRLGAVGLVRIHRWEPSTADRSADSTKLPVPLVRDLDLALWLTGQFPDRVYAVEQQPSDRPAAAAGTIQVHLGFADGGMALIDYADGLPSSDGYQSVSVIASNGAAYVDDHQNQQLVYEKGGVRVARADEGVLSWVTLVQQFVDDLKSERDVRPSVDRWRDARALATAVRRSLDSRQAVPLERGSHG